jgi:hypothetical protein
MSNFGKGNYLHCIAKKAIHHWTRHRQIQFNTTLFTFHYVQNVKLPEASAPAFYEFSSVYLSLCLVLQITMTHTGFTAPEH